MGGFPSCGVGGARGDKLPGLAFCSGAWGRLLTRWAAAGWKEEDVHEVGLWDTPQGGSQGFLALLGSSSFGEQVLQFE